MSKKCNGVVKDFPGQCCCNCAFQGQLKVNPMLKLNRRMLYACYLFPWIEQQNPQSPHIIKKHGVCEMWESDKETQA